MIRAINDIMIGHRYRKHMGDLDALMKSISEIGLLHPVVVRPDGFLIAGCRRVEAMRRLGWVEIPVTVVDIEDVIRAEHDENAIRQDFTPSEMVAIAQALRPEEEKAARERQSIGISPNTDEPCGKFPQGSSPNTDEPKKPEPKTRDRIATYFGVSGKTLDKATAVVEAATEDPDAYEDLVVEMDQKGKVDAAYRKLRDRQHRQEAEANPTAFPTGQYGLIYADPPWVYEHMTSPSRDLANQYPTMPLDAIKAMPVAGLCLEDALLYLWVTSPKLEEGLSLMKAWGFEYRTNLVWIKDKIGMGYYARQQHELILIGKKGSPRTPDSESRTSSVVSAPRLRHSQKPGLHGRLSYEYPGVPKLELFARERVGELSDWSFWGNELHVEVK